ncbi:dihydropteroate synthase [Flavobacterium sp. CBA20B-1]|uniref:dihydropteroate synthase n=1 Tax=unclassified Flavobacterium TaxID=196869 RepID=UPI00222575C6|nr:MULTISPECIES: dihydropteroate synthase [unclassified Flavobacterium]WCM42588.1 dihydropteroate synthase [Flavobacterium sp. CBA20B-1]
MKSINCKGKLITFETPKVMGILNITPNSFFDGGWHHSLEKIEQKTEKMLLEGAAIIDIGAYSTQPNAPFVSEEEELERMVPVVKHLVKKFPNAVFSIDTFRAEVAKQTLDLGAAMINDVSAGNLDDQMMPVVGSFKVPYIMMHMKGTPQSMQQFTDYDDVMHEMIYYFSDKMAQAQAHGIVDVIVDPGFGFSKTLDQNYEVLNKLDLLQNLNVPVLSALSRKSMIYKFFETTPQEALNGTTVLNTISLIKGANLLRVHDVKEAVECVKLYTKTYC